MKKKFIDYSNTIIYKICCKDENVKSIYVGHTTDFEVRKNSHKSSCKNNHLKIYKVIRENGGWDNWEMVEIARYNCKNNCEARKKEQEHFENLNADLNSSSPYVYKKTYYCSICETHCNNKKCTKHLQTKTYVNKKKQINLNIDEENNYLKYKYNCEKCKYYTLRKSSYNKHLFTLKHINNIGGQKVTKICKNVLKNYKCKCGNEYKHRQGLWKHKKTCVSILDEKEDNKINDDNFISNQKSHILFQVIKQNQEFKEVIAEQNKIILELIKNT